MRIYADTSVFGGVFDEEFSEPSKELFAEVSRGRFQLIVSAIIRAGIVAAPEAVRQLFERHLPAATIAEVSNRALGLRDAYLDADILTHRSSNDAMHVALATISECALIVSWNFRHIVHFDKICRFNAVNALYGYQSIGIFSPSQVIDYDET